MDIAIYHSLLPGGALNSLNSLKNELIKDKHKVDIFASEHNNPNPTPNKLFNLLGNLFFIFFKHNKRDKEISKYIIQSNYDLIIVFPSIYCQSPHILRFLKDVQDKVIYIFAEPPREFYEENSYDYFTISKIISRIIRLPIKYLDIINGKSAKNTVTNSHYSNRIFKKIYNKNSFTICPAMARHKPKRIFRYNDNSIFSVGMHSKLKGHEFTSNQLKMTKAKFKFSLLGFSTTSSVLTSNLFSKIKNFHLFNNNSNEQRDYLYKNSAIFISNQIKEPFGLTTLEAINSNCFVLGVNESGTSEIVRHGLDGFLYKRDNYIASTILTRFLKKKQLKYYSCTRMSWSKYSKDILSLYHYLKNEPNN